MPDRLLVTLDGSEFGEHALPFARAIAARTGAAVSLCHVHCCNPPTDLLQNTPFQYEGVSMDAYHEKAMVEQREYLRRMEEKVQAELPGNRVCSALLEGYVTEAIERHAREIDAKLLIMTTHGRTGVSRAWLGSVADSLVRYSTFPLLVIRPLEGGDQAFPSAGFEHFLVPLDGSAVGEGILGPALALGRAMGSRFTLFHVVLPQRTLRARIAPGSGGAGLDPSRAEAYLAGVAGRLAGESIEARTRIESHQAPARAILKVAEEEGADLIAIATHGYTGVKRALLGSVADKVLRGASWPLLLVRPEGPR